MARKASNPKAGGVQIAIKFHRWDRENDLDQAAAHSRKDHLFYTHSYGIAIDALLDELVGGEGQLRRTNFRPIAELEGSAATVELHEDGPLIQTIIEQIPQIIGAITGLASLWITWKSRESEAVRKRKKRRGEWVDDPRTVRIKVGDHEYDGRPRDKEQLEKIVRVLVDFAKLPGDRPPIKP
jgi:hypothetical protein